MEENPGKKSENPLFGGKKMNQRIFLLMLAFMMTGSFLLPSLHAGSRQPELRVPVKILEKGYHSGIKKADTRFVVISDPDHFMEVFEKVHSKTYPLPDLPTVDFDRQIVLAAFMGEKNTGGYQISFEKTACISNKTLRVTVFMQTPSPGAILPQVITSPYVLAAVDKGNFRRVEFVDKDGNILELSKLSGTN